ncbi:MAG: FG-GAP-like repeat-containing protein [candidate division KSB1 bacterium]|nr:FG-GAP-like repeat-containing protein [candidate division KSB1 bacterium]MDZ7318408.1 FG-GAP-like repeat-containing protein [candidate division KSB1 bacterium]MDZ7342005.1 FG-GAP-like repeat-containing protein [candidate division KSB1 bacterium]
MRQQLVRVTLIFWGVFLIIFLLSFSSLLAQDPFIAIIFSDRANSKGIGWGDYDNDGYPDIYVTNGAQGSRQKNFLFHNNGDGTFTKITTGPQSEDQFISGGCSWGDFDNDGDLDLYVATNVDLINDPNRNNFLYVNNGNGTFTKNTTAGPPVTDKEYTASVGWGDYNNDGFLDLFVKNGYAVKQANSLYASNGNGTFTDITGIPLVSGENGSFISGFAWGDYNNDGRLDLCVAGGAGPNNAIWRNDGNNTFVKLLNSNNESVIEGSDSSGPAWADYDNDGDLDLFITNYGDSGPEKNFLYRNDGNDTFTKITTGDIVNDVTYSIGMAWGDIDNDGDLDLFVGNDNDGTPGLTNFLYLNNGDGTFAKLTSSVVLDSTFTYGSAFADFNRDGFLDLFTSRDGKSILFRNNGPANGNTNHWINVQCVGTTSNRAGIGAKVRVKATINSQVVWQMREICAQNGYGGHDELRAHFGLGNATVIDELRVEWPSGNVQTLTNVATNQFLTITESQSIESLHLTAPNGGETWQVGTVHQITWTSQNTSGTVRLEYSANNGAAWNLIVANTSDDGSYEWTIPDDPSVNCLVKITDSDGVPSDQSDAVFTIAPVNYNLTMAANPASGGTTDPAVGVHAYPAGTVVTVIAVPASGYQFVNWTGTVAEPNNDTTTVTMNGNQNLTANFSLIPISDSRASIVGENILLEWSPSQATAIYNVYRDTVYNFIPDISNGSNRIGFHISDEDPGKAGIQWTDTGNGADIVGDVNKNYFYQVTAVTEVESAPSNVAGEFDYRLITTPGTDINEIVLILDTRNSSNPITSAEQLAQAIPNCSDVYYWGADGQGTVGHVKGLPFNDFPVHPGYPYIVNVTADGVWSLAGAYVDTSFSLLTTDGTDINQIGVPLSKASLTTAEQLGQDIPGCTDVYQWGADGQGTIGHVVGLPFNDFPVRVGYPYYVNVTAPTIWPTSGTILKADPGAGEKRVRSSGGAPHTVYGKLNLATGESVKPQDIEIRTWITSRPEEVLTSKQLGIGYDNNYWWVGVSNFATNWAIGETLMVEITMPKSGLRGTTVVQLTAAGSDNGGTILLATANNDPSMQVKELPQEFVLQPNYPNPFNAETVIGYGVPRSSYVKIQIFDIAGRCIRTLIAADQDAGYHQVRWNGKDNQGVTVGSGVYLCRMEAAGFQANLKMIMIK